MPDAWDGAALERLVLVSKSLTHFNDAAVGIFDPGCPPSGNKGIKIKRPKTDIQWADFAQLFVHIIHLEGKMPEAWECVSIIFSIGDGGISIGSK